MQKDSYAARLKRGESPSQETPGTGSHANYMAWKEKMYSWGRNLNPGPRKHPVPISPPDPAATAEGGRKTRSIHACPSQPSHHPPSPRSTSSSHSLIEQHGQHQLVGLFGQIGEEQDVVGGVLRQLEGTERETDNGTEILGTA